jgi:hypothetical protein
MTENKLTVEIMDSNWREPGENVGDVNTQSSSEEVMHQIS